MSESEKLPNIVVLSPEESRRDDEARRKNRAYIIGRLEQMLVDRTDSPWVLRELQGLGLIKADQDTQEFVLMDRKKLNDLLESTIKELKALDPVTQLIEHTRGKADF